MPTYREILNSEVAVGSVIDQATMQTLKDNTEAVFQGDVTAPPIQMAALHRATPTSGNNLILQVSEVYTVDNTSLLGFKVRLAGTYRIRIRSRMGDTTGQSSEDGAMMTNNLTCTVKKTTAGGSTTTLFTHTSNLATHTGNQDSIRESDNDVTLAVGDHVNLDCNTANGANDFPNGTITLEVAVDDHDAMWGAAVYAVM